MDYSNKMVQASRMGLEMWKNSVMGSATLSRMDLVTTLCSMVLGCMMCLVLVSSLSQQMVMGKYMCYLMTPHSSRFHTHSIHSRHCLPNPRHKSKYTCFGLNSK